MPMNAQPAPVDSDIEAGPEGARALLRSVVITELCDSTALVDRLGDVRATELIRAHDRLLRGLIREHRGQEIDKTDGFLSLFERPIQAVAFALAYQRGLRAFSLEHGVEISARIGLHVGEVMTWQNDEADIAKGAKPTEVEGLAKPVAARLMGMALPGQILLSGVAYTLAHRAEGELGAALSRVLWKAHGDFRFKGVAEAVPVYEIGEEGIAPFKAPAWSGKAHREVPLWRRPTMLAFEVIALIVAVALPAWHFLKPEPAIAFAERDWVVLADLRNLTGDPRFDDSLEQAFRIGLEQSRHVNVLSDLQVRDTLQRMQRDSDSPVDRSVGAEIAMREGARALVLPTLAEVGGRLRFTAEVVDPTTHATVYSRYADGRGVESVLPLVDEVNRKLREDLGEAITQVNETSKPLQSVATPDLDALRSYSRAIELIDEGRGSEATGLLERSLEIDPGFARAELMLGVLRYQTGDFYQATEHFSRSLASKERLSIRETGLAEGWLATLTSSYRDSIQKWRLLDLQYPEFFAASGALAWNLWRYENDNAEALRVLARNIDQRNPRRAIGLYLRGVILTSEEDADAARAAFEEARALGMSNTDRPIARISAASRDFALAAQLLASAPPPNSDAGRASLALLRSTLELDVAANERGLAELTDTYASINPSSTWARRVLLQAASAVGAAIGEAATSATDEPRMASSDIAAPLDLLERQAGAEAATELTEALKVLWADRLSGKLASASDAIALVQSRFESGRYPEVDHWLRILRAEEALQVGATEHAFEIVAQNLGRTESVAARFIGARAQLAAGEHKLALETSRRLYNRRGHAYADTGGSQWMLPVNVMMSSFGHCLATLASIDGGTPDVAEAEGSLLRSTLPQQDSARSEVDLVTTVCSRFPTALPAASRQTLMDYLSKKSIREAPDS